MYITLTYFTIGVIYSLYRVHKLDVQIELQWIDYYGDEKDVDLEYHWKTTKIIFVFLYRHLIKWPFVMYVDYYMKKKYGEEFGKFDKLVEEGKIEEAREVLNSIREQEGISKTDLNSTDE